MPAVFNNHPSCRIALYSRKFPTPFEPAPFFGLVCAFVWLLREVARDLNTLGISVIAMLSVNLFLYIFNRLLLSRRLGMYALIVDLRTVTVTSCDYSDVGLADRDWNPTEGEGAIAKKNVAFGDFVGGAVFDTDKGDLFVHGSSNIALLNKKVVIENSIRLLLYDAIDSIPFFVS